MSLSDEKIIYLSKTKIILLIVGSIAFVCAAIYMISLDDAQILASRYNRRFFNNPFLVHSIGWAGAVFFSLCAAVGIKKFFDKKPGLIFSSSGMTDNSSGLSAGHIPWNEITGFKIFEVSGQKMLVVLLKTPEKYIDTVSTIKRNLVRVNYKMCGSPVCIASNALQMNFEELVKISGDYFEKYGSAA